MEKRLIMLFEQFVRENAELTDYVAYDLSWKEIDKTVDGDRVTAIIFGDHDYPKIVEWFLRQRKGGNKVFGFSTIESKIPMYVSLPDKERSEEVFLYVHRMIEENFESFADAGIRWRSIKSVDDI